MLAPPFFCYFCIPSPLQKPSAGFKTQLLFTIRTHFISCFSTNFFLLLSKSTISVTYLHYLYTFKLPKIFCILKNESHSAFFQVSSFKIQIQIPRFHFFSVFYPSTPKGFLFFFLHFFVETLFLARFASLIRFDFFP